MKAHLSPVFFGKGKTSLFLGGLLLVALLHAFFLFRNLRDLCDDAMISARYARNLAAGQGLRYNPALAEEKPVEGYSNFLWTLGLALGFKLRLHPRVTTAVMGMASAVFSIIALGIWVWKRTGVFLPSLIAVLLLGSSLPFCLWAAQGLETPLFALFLLLAMSADHPAESRGPAYTFATLAALTRPDGLLAPAALILARFRNRRASFPTLGRVFLFFVLPYGIYTLFRWIYFGSLLPNVFYAKTGLGLAGFRVGLEYVGAGILRNWPVFGLFLLGVFLEIHRLRRLVPNHSDAGFHDFPAPLLLILMYSVFIMAVGGDFMPDHRFLMHLLPLVIGTGLIGAGRSVLPPGHRRLIILLLGLCGLGWNAFENWQYRSRPSFSRDWHENQAVWYGRPAAWLVRHARPADLIAAGDIGYLGYVTETNPLLDTNGLVNRHLARRAGAAGFSSDPDYVLDQQPHFLVVMVHYFNDGRQLGHSAFDRAVLGGPRLGQEYSPVVELPGWRSLEKSRSDGKTRESLVRFRIYRRK